MSKGGGAKQRVCFASWRDAHEKQLSPVRGALRGGVWDFVLCRRLSHSLLGAPRKCACACVRTAVVAVSGETGFCSVFLPLMALSTCQAERRVCPHKWGP